MRLVVWHGMMGKCCLLMHWRYSDECPEVAPSTGCFSDRDVGMCDIFRHCSENFTDKSAVHPVGLFLV